MRQTLTLGYPTAANKTYDACLENIYRSWRIQRETSDGLRAGFGLCGLFPFDEFRPITLDKSISVTEHEAGVSDLSTQMLLSGIFRVEDAEIDLFKLLFLVSLVARLHDHAERLLGGDIAQDGTRDDVFADKSEIGVFEGMIAPLYSPLIEVELIDIFSDFVWRKSDIGCLLFAADKADEVLTSLYMEENGKVASIIDKENLTATDLERTDFAGRFEYTDVVMLHFLDLTNDFLDIRQPFVDLIRIACAKTHYGRPARETWFPWWEKYLSVHNLPH